MTTLSSTGPAGVQTVCVSLLTPPGRGALAVVGVAGSGAAVLVDRLFAARGRDAVAMRPDGAVVYGTWRSSGEDVVVVRHAADRIEVHGHGGAAAPAAVLASLVEAGAAPGAWQHWLDGGTCRREALESLPGAWGPKAAMILSRQAAGALDEALAGCAARVAGGELAAARLLGGRLLAAARVGLRLTCPWRIVLAGRVNAGKSSLMNALIGHDRSIVAAVPGTTRDVVAAPAVLQGWAVELIDVAGSRDDGEPASATERAGIARAAAARATADLVVRVVPVEDLGRGGPAAGANELTVVSKTDQSPPGRSGGMIATSAVTGEGIGELVAAIIDRLVPEERRDPDLLAGPVPWTNRQVEVIAQLIAQPT